MNFNAIIRFGGAVMETAGVCVIVLGVVLVSGVYLRATLTGEPDAAFRNFRQGVGRSILLGLEFLVAGDIIRTVAIEPTFTSIGVLAMIVVIRTFLSWSLEVELEGKWPWQRRGTTPPD